MGPRHLRLATQADPEPRGLQLVVAAGGDQVRLFVDVNIRQAVRALARRGSFQPGRGKWQV